MRVGVVGLVGHDEPALAVPPCVAVQVFMAAARAPDL